MKHFIEGSVIAFDTETNGIDIWKGDSAFAFSFANPEGETAYFEFTVDPFTRQPQIGKKEEETLKAVKDLLEDVRITKILHNAKFDVRNVELAYGIVVAGPGGPLRDGGTFHDTMIMAHNCNTQELSLGLKQLGDKYCGIDTADKDTLKKAVAGLRRFTETKLGWKTSYDHQPQPFGPPKKKANTSADYWIPNTLHHLHGLPDKYKGTENLCGDYAKKDALRTIMLWMLYSDLIKEYQTQDIYKLECELWPVFYRMEERGVRTDQKILQKHMAECVDQMKEIYPRLEAVAGTGFRPKASADVRKLFYETLEFPVTKYTKGGKTGDNKKPAADKHVIREHLSHPVVHDLAIWQSNCVAYTTFFAKFDQLSTLDPNFPGCTALHADWRQVGGDQSGDRGGVGTGRVSSSKPNMQNVMTPETSIAVHPIPVRQAFIPRPGYNWLCTDYEGMEVRMFAAVSNEPFMMSAVNAGRSIHDEMTNYIWGGRGNPEAVKQSIRALSLDGSGGHQSNELDRLWKLWGVTKENVASLPEKQQYDLAEKWLADFNYNQVEAQKSIEKKTSKAKIKMLTFLKIYGGGPKKAQLILECSYPEAKRILDHYDDLFPGVPQTFNALMNIGRVQGFITSMWGRRLTIEPGFEYRATNYMIQGSSADCMKRAMVRMDEWFRQEKLDAHIIMTIHDEIVVEFRKELRTPEFIKKVCFFMSDTEGHLPIDMTVEPKIVTDNWAVKRKVKF